MSVRIGIIGVGGRSIREVRDLVEIPEAEIAALCDIDEPRCAAAVETINGSLPEGASPIQPGLFSDHRAMLDAVELDAVYISLPTFAHGQLDHDVIAAGKAVLIEKPIAIELSLAKEIAAHIAEKGVVNSVGYQMRYAPSVGRTRELLAGVPIGMVIAVRWGGLPGTPWWKIQEQSGGMLIEQHTHGIDLVRYFVGEPDTIYAAGDTVLLTDEPGLTIFDVNAATVRFKNRAVGMIGNSPAAHAGIPPNVTNVLHILAKDLTVTAGFDSTTVWRPGQETETITSDQDSNLLLNQAFVNAVANNTQEGILSPYSDSLRSFAFTYAAQKSAELRREVRLTDDLEVAPL